MPPLAYFAYGSNMLRLRLLARNVVLLDQGQPAVAEGFKLVFNKASIDGSTKANLAPATRERTWGVVFTLDPGSLNDLDKAEGAPDHYLRPGRLIPSRACAQAAPRTSEHHHESSGP